MNIKEKFIQWMESKDRVKQELVDVVVKDGNDFKIEKLKSGVIEITTNDWKEFCDEYGIEYEKIELITLC